MPYAKFKVVKEIDFDGKKQMLGAELILDTADAEELVDTGSVVLSRHLDTSDPDDARIIRDLEEVRGDEQVDDEARDEADETLDEEEDGEFEDHTITQEDLDLNPELVEEGIKVGDVVGLPKKIMTEEEAKEAGIDTEKVQADIKKKKVAKQTPAKKKKK